MSTGPATLPQPAVKRPAPKPRPESAAAQRARLTKALRELRGDAEQLLANAEKMLARLS